MLPVGDRWCINIIVVLLFRWFIFIRSKEFCYRPMVPNVFEVQLYFPYWNSFASFTCECFLINSRFYWTYISCWYICASVLMRCEYYSIVNYNLLICFFVSKFSSHLWVTGHMLFILSCCPLMYSILKFGGSIFSIMDRISYSVDWCKQFWWYSSSSSQESCLTYFIFEHITVHWFVNSTM